MIIMQKKGGCGQIFQYLFFWNTGALYFGQLLRRMYKKLVNILSKINICSKSNMKNRKNSNTCQCCSSVDACSEIREVCGKSKWKFKMAFAMKGGGLEGVSSATYLSEK